MAMLMISDRKDFWNTEDLPRQTFLANVPETGNRVEIDENKALKSLKNKKVLFLVHGYNNGQESVRRAYTKIQTALCGEGKPFDVAVGYVWPGYDQAIEYYPAVDNSIRVASSLRKYLFAINERAQSVSVMAHSMGNRALLEAMSWGTGDNPKQFENFFSLAGAVSNNSLNDGENYFRATNLFKNIYVMTSFRDKVLGIFFDIANFFKNALGYTGPVGLTAKNVSHIDLTDIVSGHSNYNTPEFFETIDKIMKGEVKGTEPTNPSLFEWIRQSISLMMTKVYYIGLSLMPCSASA